MNIEPLQCCYTYTFFSYMQVCIVWNTYMYASDEFILIGIVKQKEIYFV